MTELETKLLAALEEIRDYAKRDGDAIAQHLGGIAGRALDEATRHLPVAEASDGWIPWAGGECPVASSTRVDVRCRNGEEFLRYPADEHEWDCDNDAYDIIAYRVVKEG